MPKKEKDFIESFSIYNGCIQFTIAVMQFLFELVKLNKTLNKQKMMTITCS